VNYLHDWVHNDLMYVVGEVTERIPIAALLSM